MGVENEIVRFIAEIDMDPQDAAAFSANLKKANEECETLRQTITATSQQMAVMRAKGEENSEEYKKLSATLTASHKQLKEQVKQANKYSAALDKGKMSIKQLRDHAKQLRSALSTMHKEADPQLWDKYNKELADTEERLAELKIGSKGAQESLLSFGKLKEAVKTPAFWLTATASATAAVWGGFKKMTEQTQVWGDKWGLVTAQVSAGWNQLIANIAQGDNVIKSSIRDAMAAAKEAQLLRDELFERQNSMSIKSAEYQGLINAQQAIAQDSSKSAEERMAALNEILRLEKELAETKRSIAEQTQQAAILELKTRTGLTEEQLKLIIDEYESNRLIVKEAERYNDVLAQIESTQANISRLKMMDGSDGADLSSMISSSEERLAALERERDSFSQTIQEYGSYIRQYNLGNDEMVKAYVDATVQILQADNDLSSSLASQARRRGALTNQITAEQKQQREKDYKDRLAAVDEHYKKELIILQTALSKGEITESQFTARSLAAEVVMLEKKKAVMTAYGESVTEIELQIAQKRTKIQLDMEKYLEKKDADFKKKMAEQLKEYQKDMETLAMEGFEQFQEELDNDPLVLPLVVQLFNKNKDMENVSEEARRAEIDADYGASMTELQQMYDLKLISEKEFLARKMKLNTQYYHDIMALELESKMSSVSVATDFLNELSLMTSSIKEAEMASLDAQMEKELAMAGDNAEARAAIEAKYEAKRLDLQKKYADVEMGIQIAQALAAGAMAVMQSFAQLGPIAGAIMAGLVTATTAAQVAVIIAQRKAIKNSSPGSSSGGSYPAGYSEGGYTGHGGRMEVAGVVHRGEYVVPQPELRDPAVAAMVASIESKRRRRTSAHALPGFAEGGYTGSADTPSDQTTPLLTEILALLYSISDTPIPAYISLSDIDAAQDIRSRFRSRTSLK